MKVELAKEVRSYEVAGKKIKIGGASLPELRQGERLLRTTSSLCPECLWILPAIVFERDGKVWIRKTCPIHGEFEELYYGSYDMYVKAMKWYDEGKGASAYNTKLKAPCPFSCGLCPLHKTNTILANIVATNRCDLSCWYCFFYAEKAGYVYEPTIEQIRSMVRNLRRQGITMSIQLTGGEPLLRDDIVDVVKALKEEGVTHVQLNTHGIRFSQEEGLELAMELRRAGVNTVYLSFDGVTPEANPKNHWEVPYILEVFKEAGMTSTVLVPTVIKGYNDHEIGLIVKFGAMNTDLIRAVNFQPVSLTGRMPRAEREKYRITIPEVIEKLEEQTDGQIDKESWFPVPVSTIISDFIEALTGGRYVRMSAHPVCGMATYVYVERKGKHLKDLKLTPITRFVDIEGFLEYLKEKTEELRRGSLKPIVAFKLLFNIRKFIDKEHQPKDFKLSRLIYKVLVRHDYRTLGEFHYKFLFIGMMHFMDLYNYDIQRVLRCCIHYLVPDGRIIPFCAFNVIPEVYRDYIQKEYGIPIEEWAKMKGRHTVGEAVKYRRDIKKLSSGDVYRRYYDEFLKEARSL